MERRTLSQMLVDVASGAFAARDRMPMVHARAVELTLPVEVRMRAVHGELQFFADVPVWRWRTVFDQQPSQLRVAWREVEGE